ncbi:MAG: CBS domain-containing protein [Thiohalophilus sp.]|uniref:CBS domain-containing protein n=1 Tax=Thiohalophilus sp. TaxID=3028392 RepID=UPI002870A226|nr:CBS domain-containing protein [Thiohalophilus sp.]MDR9436453.1 CBS domain-containing protein [Thiohalophilus sp.]
MSTHYTSLPLRKLSNHIGYHRPHQMLPDHLTLDMPAIYAMTDLQRVAAVTVEPATRLDAANQKMIANQVRLLLVCRSDNSVAGILTATDILGEKPVQYMHEVGCTYADIMVRDIMTPYDELDVLALSDIQMACVGDVVATLQQVVRQHALVIDNDRYGLQRVRGIFSVSHISRQLGMPIPESGRAHSFAELEQALAAG